jgi:carbon-monoxide dehydrogenase small subunit
MDDMEITFNLNFEEITVQVSPKMTLLNLLRDHLGKTGSKPGCETGDCGACSVLIDGELTNSCLYLVRGLPGKHVLTIEGLAGPDNTPNDLQQAFITYGATQCGYCTPGMVMAGEALLAKNLSPTREEIRASLEKNLCRCTGYLQIIEAIEATAEVRKKAVK